MPDISAMESNYVKLLKEYNDLAEGYERLQQHLDEETKFHQEQTSQNVAVMTDMQDTITQLRNQLAELRSTRSASSGVCLFSRAFNRLHTRFQRLHVFARFLLHVTCFAAISISYLFSRPFHPSHVFADYAVVLF